MQALETDKPGRSIGSRAVFMDGGFTYVMGSISPQWKVRSQEVHWFDNIVLRIIDPVDLAVSKLARFSERDREDVRALAERGLIDPDAFGNRADEALEYYIGNLTFVRFNVSDARGIVSSVWYRSVRTGGITASKQDESEADSGCGYKPF